MSKVSEKHVLLFLVLAFSFAYRLLLMQRGTFPPGADIGLHNSVIYSITSSGNTDFFWNFYQMGGGLSLTFPGYHIFVAFMIFMTGLPDFLAHSLVVCLFSTITVACSYLVARKVWGESTGLIVAFLVAVSRFDIEMLLWGGYPNVATLMLIPLCFYMFLQKERFTLFPFLLTTTLLSGAVYLTHSLSAVIFVIITFSLAIFAIIFSRQLDISKRYVGTWLLPLFLGAIVVSPFLIDAVPAYLGANRGTITGGVFDIRQALLSTRVLPPEIVVPLFACVVFFFLFSKEYKGKYLTIPALLFTLWILVPMLFTQSFLVGLYTDYNRFLYFVLLPIIMLIGLGIYHAASFFERIADMYQSFRSEPTKRWKNTSKAWLELQRRLTLRQIYSSFAVAFLLIAFLAVPIFVTPFQGVAVQSFYQVATEPNYEAILWAKENTAIGSRFVSDALYGWWLSGFALRPTISAVDPQYLTLSRELEPAMAAKSLLDTDYVIDNGLIQVREDGGYIGRHNPMFLGKLNWTYFPYPFFNFNNEATIITFTKGGETKFIELAQIPVTSMTAQSSFNETSHSLNNASVTVSRANGLFNYTQILTVYRGTKFVNMSITLESSVEDVSLVSVNFMLETKGKIVQYGGPAIAFLDEGAKVLGQLIFVESQPFEPVSELLYKLNGDSETEIQLWAGVFSVSNDESIYQDSKTKMSYLDGIISYNVDNYSKIEPKVTEGSDYFFDYRKTLLDWNVSYIANRDPELMPKFAKDPLFSLVFINDEVAIFKVKRN